MEETEKAVSLLNATGIETTTDMSSADEDRRASETAETDYITDDEREYFFRQPGKGAVEASFRAGTVLAGRFEIVRFLARGGMGEVYEARDQFLQGTPVALKTILPQSARDAEARVRLEQEVMLARAIVHPNVCPIYDLFECQQHEGCTSFLTMKLLRGETLARRLGKGRMAVEEAEPVARQICGALRAAHRAGVVHRDLKPGNVMLEGRGETVRAVVTDFGIARDYQETVTAGPRAHVLGTPGYIAPELFRSEAASPASDLYALGVVLHQVWTGRKPVKAARGEAKWKGVQRFWRELTEACLSDEPEARTHEFERAARYLRLDGDGPAGRRDLIERRALLGFGAAAACAWIGRVFWDGDAVENWLHPLPKKRFVALLGFPTLADPGIQPLVAGALRAIEAELSRAEAFDRNLFIIAAGNAVHADRRTALASAQKAWGANLVLEAQGTTLDGEFRLLLRVMDAASGAVLRAKHVVGTATELATEAVGAAAEILGVRLPKGSSERTASATQSEAAYKAYEAGEALMKQPNDSGLNRALEQYRKAVEEDPRFAEAYAALAVAYCRLYSLQRGAAVLDLARSNAEAGLRLNKGLVNGYMALSSVNDLTGSTEMALVEIGKALALDPSNARTLLWQAQIYRRSRKWVEAERIYRKILGERPNYWPAYNDLGYVLGSQGRYQEALRAFQAAMTAAPQVALAFDNAGEMYFRLGDYQKASDSFKRSLVLTASDSAYGNLARTMRAQGKNAEALNLNLKAVAINPDEDQNWLDLADCYAWMGRTAEARNAYRRAREEADKAVQIDQTDSGALLRLAFYRLKTNEANDWRLSMKKADGGGALDLDSQMIRVRTFEAGGDRAGALAALGNCFANGLTKFEIALIPDLRALQKDAGYARVAKAVRVDRKLQ